MRGNEKGASKTVGVLAAETNQVERLHGWEVWNRPKTLSVMTKRDWSSIHDEVKYAESMKTTTVVWVLGWNKTKRGKTLVALSFFIWLYIYIYIYLCIVKTEYCWMHVWLKIECVYLLKIIKNDGIANSLPKNGHEWAHVPIGKAWKIWKSPWWDLDCHANWAINWLILMPILCLV